MLGGDNMAGIASVQHLLSSRHSQESVESTSLIRQSSSGVESHWLSWCDFGLVPIPEPVAGQRHGRSLGLALVMCSNPSSLEITFLEGGEAHLPGENQDLLQKIQREEAGWPYTANIY